MPPSGGRHKAKVFFVSPLWEMWKVSKTQDYGLLSARALVMRFTLFLWVVTPYQAECGVYRSLPRTGFHNLPQDKRK